jgi:hypothetical protein
MGKNGASEGIRTLDTHVGNVMLYQAELRSLPEGLAKIREPALDRKPCFRRTECGELEDGRENGCWMFSQFRRTLLAGI